MCANVFVYVTIGLFCSFSTLVKSQRTLTSAQISSCTLDHSEQIVAVSGWPFLLNCDDLIKTSDLTDTSSSNCYVSSSDLSPQLSNETIKLNGADSVTSLTVSLIINGSECRRKTVEVNVRNLMSGKVQSGIQSDLANNKDVIQRSVVYNDELIMQCLPPQLGYLALPPGYNTTWWRTKVYENGTFDKGQSGFVNYTEFLSEGSRVYLISYDDKPPAIDINQAKYWEPGTFTCQLQYENETVFIAHQTVCVKNEVDRTSGPSVLCSKTKYFFANEEVSLTCKVQTSNSQIKAGQMEVVWKKISPNQGEVCQNKYDGDNMTASENKNSKYICKIDGFTNLPQKCFHYTPSNSEITSSYPSRKTFDIELKIGNYLENEAGNFSVMLMYEGMWSDAQVITVEFDPQRKLVKIVLILTGVLVFLLTIATAVAFVWWKWIRIQLFIRRHFGKYDEDGKEFVAILSYVYSTELEESTRNKTKKIVKCIQEKMEEMNYRFYDSHRDFDQGSSVENLLKYLNESHRMIVILTEAYVDERWSRFEAQQGFINMLKNKTKLIFIRTPGAGKALNKCKKKGDDFSKELDEALKASRNVRWNEKMSDSSLKDHVEYALPNLKRSPSDSKNSGKKYKKLDNYTRSFSQQTQISMLSTPDLNEASHFSKSIDVTV